MIQTEIRFLTVRFTKYTHSIIKYFDKDIFGKLFCSITETKGGFISEDGLFTYSFKDSDLTLYNSLEAIEELHKITFFYSDGINPEQQHLGN